MKEYPRVQHISIKGLLCRDKRVLFLKTPAGKWELPGGKMNFGENVEEAFRREMKEELGFENVKMLRLINAWSFTSIREEVSYHFIIFDFEIETNESKIKISDEHTEYKWIGEGEYEDLNMREGHKATLRKYFSK